MRADGPDAFEARFGARVFLQTGSNGHRPSSIRLRREQFRGFVEILQLDQLHRRLEHPNGLSLEFGPPPPGPMNRRVGVMTRSTGHDRSNA